MDLLDATSAEIVIMGLLAVGFAIIGAVQIRPSLRHRLRRLNLLLPLAPYRLFLVPRPLVRLQYRDQPSTTGSPPPWRDLPLRLPRTATTWICNPALHVLPPVFEYVHFLADERKIQKRRPESVQLARDVVAAFVAQQPGNDEAAPADRTWRLVAEDDKTVDGPWPAVPASPSLHPAQR